MTDPRSLAETHNRFRRSCYQAALLFLNELPADNALRPVAASDNVYGGKRPDVDTIKGNLYKAAKELRVEITVVSADGFLLVAKFDRALALKQLVEAFERRHREIPGYAPLELVSTFETI